MTTPKILVVEDELKVADFIKRGLEENQYQADVANDGLSGRQMALLNKYEAIILDVNLPHLSGNQLCRELRQHNIQVPVLMLTALSATEDKLAGFDSGADDYLVKPFEFRELLARIKVMLKRSAGKIDQGSILKVADLEVNLESKVVRRAGKKIELTNKEFLLLEYLLRNKGRVLSRSDIAEKIWDITFDTGTNVIDVYVNFLRKKIDKDFTPKLIHTQIGMGYILKEDED